MMRTTIEMAREAGLRDCTCNGTLGCLERFTEIVRADERARMATDKSKEAMKLALEAVYETIIQWDEGGGKRSRRELARRIVALAEQPAQRKPLTDEKVEKIIKDNMVLQMNLAGIRQDFEAAHGIKENT